MDINSGLLVHLPFEGNGDDASGNGRNFTASGTPTYETGKLGQAARVTWTNNLHFGTPTWFSGRTAYTVAAWLYDTGFVAGSAAISWGTASAGASTVIYPFDTDSGNGLRIFNKNVSAAVNINTGYPTVNAWNHFAMVVSASVAKIYIDGRVRAIVPGNFSTDASLTDIMVGSYHNSNQTYTGLIDELKIYSRALRANDVRALALSRRDA